MHTSRPAATGANPTPWRLSLPNNLQAVVLDAHGLIVFTTGDRELATRIIHLANIDTLVAEMASVFLRLAQSRMPGKDADAVRHVVAGNTEALHALASRYEEAHESAPVLGALSPEQMARGELRVLVTRLEQANAMLEAVTGEGQQWLDGALALGRRRLGEGENQALPLQGIGVGFPGLSPAAAILVRRFAYAIASSIDNLRGSENLEDVHARLWEAIHQGDMRAVAACAAILWNHSQHPLPGNAQVMRSATAGHEADSVHL